jgi:hypothetical protein
MRIVQFAQLRLLADLYPRAGRPGTSRPLVVRLLRRFPPLPRLVARMVGLGLRLEHVPRVPVSETAASPTTSMEK